MKRFLVIITMCAIVTAAYPEEIKHPEYDYFYVIKEQNDVNIVLKTIKTWISKYRNYNCSIKNAEEGTEKLACLAIKKIPMNFGPSNDVAHCQFYLNGKRIDLFLSENEILGLTQEYKANEAEEVYNKVYSLYFNNMRGNLGRR
jgi:hypothetical protein